MSVQIIVHKTYNNEAIEASGFIYKILNELYPNKTHLYYDGWLMTIDNRITIDFRCGTNPDKMGGLIVNYYYTDDSYFVADSLEQSASKHNGRRLYNLGHVIQIVSFYMNMFSEIDEWLEAQK